MSCKINEVAIQKKFSSFARSASGQRVIRDIIQVKITSGATQYSVTGDIITEAEMLEAAEKMKSILIQHSTGLPLSIQAVVSNISIGPLTQTGQNTWTISLQFHGDFARPSLVPSKYGYVSNIVALFNNGYRAGGQVYGEWHGHKTASLQERAGTHFINQAVATFNSSCGPRYHAEATASSEYV